MSSKVGPQFTPERLRPALSFIEGYWKKLEKFNPHDDGTLVGLPRPYFVPSVNTGQGHQFEEMYYWDTYFTAFGFLGTEREHLIRGLAENLLALQRRFRIIPNSGRTYHTAHSQPPFLSSFIMMVYQIEKNKRWLEQAMSVAKDEYRYVWMGTTHPNWRQVFNGLSRQYDINVLDDLAELESGWDMTTRFERKALSYLPVDLNALLYKYERDFEDAAKILGEKEEAAEWAKRSLARKGAMQKYMWDDELGFYFDYNFMTGKRGPVWSLAGFFPMWAGLDDEDSAKRIIENLDKFEYEGGLVTTAKKPYVHTPLPVQWAYPNGWAPLHLVAVEAMERYGYHVDAERIARKWINANLVRFEESGDFLEKYNVVDIKGDPEDGVYPTHVGFGWTNAVFVRFCQKYLRPDEMPEIESKADLPPLSHLVRNPRQTLKRVGVKLNVPTPKRFS
ncbi:MAG TPA: trehalase family glycosidase [Candidatus Saccharimonadia bacterium]|jgi:alpha,alpha-trehalase